MKIFIKNCCFIIILWTASCAGFSATYYYQLYLHNEYYAEPPGFPSKIVIAPIVASFSGNGTPSDQWKETRFLGGIIEALRLVHNHTWIEFIAAFGKENVRFSHKGVFGRESRAGWDDFLIDVGHNFLDASGKKQLLVHWLTGVPLTRKVTLAEVESPLWGIRTIATGPVIEFAYDFIRNPAQDLFLGIIARFLHLFKRTYEPILPSDAFFHPGNALDILALFHYRYEAQNIEIGYIYTRYNNISYQFHDHTQHLPSERYNSFYGDYFYFSEEKSMSFEINIAKTFGDPFSGITIYGSVAYYF